MNRRILIVDDDRAYVDAVRSVLEAAGYQVMSACTGEEGILMAQNQPPDLIIMDVMMARLTEGFDVSRELAKQDKLRTIPILLVTGIREAMHLPSVPQPDETWLPVRAVLEKPIKPQALLAEIQKALG